jgi:hypothetical protein
MPPERLLSRGPETQRHQRPSVRWIGFVHAHERDTLRLELVGDERQVQLITAREYDGVRVRREVTGAGFAGSMHKHGGLDAAWQVSANGHVMRDRVLRSAALSRDRVVDRKP